MKKVGFILIALICFAFPKTTAQVAMEDDVVINEFVVNPSAGKEYVELLVTKPGGVNMQGWTLSDVGTRTGSTSMTEGDVTLPAAASYLSCVPTGTYVVIVFTTPSANANTLTEDVSLEDGNNKLVLIVGTTAGVTTNGTIDTATADNLQLYAGTRAAGTLIDQVLAGNNTSLISGATWGDNNSATMTDNINGGSAMPSNSLARFVPTANTLAGFQDNDTGARFVVDANSYGTPGTINTGVTGDSAVTNPSFTSGMVPAGCYNGLSIDGAVSLAGDTTVYGVLTLNNDLTTGSFNLIQPASGTSAGTGDVVGNVRRSGFTGGGPALSFGNPFNSIAFASGGTLPTSVTINLVKSAPIGFATAVTRTYTITPSGGSGFSATVRLHYLDAELNGNTEATLKLFRFDSPNWTEITPTAADTTDNWVEASGITTFSPWTLASQGPAMPVCTLTPTTATNQAGTMHTVTATVTQNSMPQSGVTVNFSVTAGPNMGASSMATTDMNGQATFTYTSNGTVGTDTITASGLVMGNPFTCTAMKTWVAPACSLSPATATNPVNTMHTVTVTVTNGGSPASGITVNFSVTAGPNMGASGTSTTDTNGQAMFTYTSNGTPGTDTIQASGNIGGVPFSCTATKDWVAVGCSLSPASATNQVGTMHTVTATVTQNGMPQSGVTVNFSVTAGPNTGVNGMATTDTNGQAMFTYTSNGTPGTDTIQASGTIGTIPFSCTATKTWINAACSLTPLTDTNLVGSTHTVTVTVTQNGTPQSGVTVNFSVTTGPNAGVNGMGTTNAGGQATFTYTSNGTPGTDTIQASGSLSGVAFSCMASKTWIAVPPIIINEVDSDTPSTDMLEFVELYDGGTGNTSLTGLVVVFYNGANDLSYAAFDLDGFSTDANGYFVLGNAAVAGVDLVFADNFLQNGADAVALYLGDASNFPNNTPVTTNNLIDALVYDTSDPDDPGLLVLLNAGQPQVDEDGAGSGATQSMQRCPNGSGGARNTSTYITATPTPDGANNCPTPMCTLAPATATNPVGSIHMVTAAVTFGGVPQSGIAVTFNVTAGPNMGTSGTATTDTNGQAMFSYTGSGGAGTDTITASGMVSGQPFSCTASKTWTPPVCTLTPMTATNPVGSMHTVTATVTSNGAPLSGVTVNFSVTAGPNMGTSGMATTDTNGQAMFTYTSNGMTGTDTITASGSVGGVPFSCTATKDWVSVACSLTPPTDTNPVGSMHTLTATVTQGGSPASGVTVNFSVTAGPNMGTSGTATTDTNGQAMFSYTGSGGAGTDTITASGTIAGSPFSCTASKTWVLPSCSLAPLSDTNPAGTMHTVTVTVTEGGAPVSAITVNFTVTAGPNMGVNGMATTDNNGQAMFTYMSNGTPGTDTITASGTVNSNSFSCTASKTWTPAAPAIIINEVDSDTPSTDTLEFIELYDGGVGNTSLNGFVVVFYNGATDQSYAAFDLDGFTTDSNGYFVLGNAAVAGVDLVFSDNFLQNGADAVALYTANGSDFPNNTPVTTTNLVDALVYDTSDPDDAGLLVLLNAGQPQVDENGAGSGTTQSMQRCPNGSGGARNTSTYITATPTPKATNNCPSTAACSLAPATATNPVGSMHTVTVTVTNSGNPAAGVTVNFSVTAGPNAGTTGTATTNTSGQAMFTYTSNGMTGTDTITAGGSVSGQPFSCTATKTWVPAGVACTLTPPTATNPVGTNHTVTVTVTNNGNPAAGVTVNFSVTAGPNAGTTGTGTTNTSGQATFTYTSNGMTGTDTIQASGTISGMPFSCTATKTWTALPPIIINEVDADTPGSEDMEFVELYDGGIGGMPLDGLVVVFYNGFNDQSYAAFDLDGYVTNANGYFVLGNAGVPNVNLVFANNTLQNGADAVALYVGNASSFPNGTPVTTAGLIDALVYDTNDPDDPGLLVLLNPGQPQVNEGANNNSANESNQRCPNGAGGPRNTITYKADLPTPGAANRCDVIFVLEDDRLEQCVRLNVTQETYTFRAHTGQVFTGPVMFTTQGTILTFQSKPTDPNYLTGGIDLRRRTGNARLEVPRGRFARRYVINDINIDNNGRCQ